YIILLAEGEKPDSIKLSFKDPLRPRKALLREGRCHRLGPFRERHERHYDASQLRPAKNVTRSDCLRTQFPYARRRLAGPTPGSLLQRGRDGDLRNRDRGCTGDRQPE